MQDKVFVVTKVKFNVCTSKANAMLFKTKNSRKHYCFSDFELYLF